MLTRLFSNWGAHTELTKKGTHTYIHLCKIIHTVVYDINVYAFILLCMILMFANV